MKHLKRIDTSTAGNRNLRAEDGFQLNGSRNRLQEALLTPLASLLAIFLLTLLVGRSAWGQTSGRITGTVKDYRRRHPTEHRHCHQQCYGRQTICRYRWGWCVYLSCDERRDLHREGRRIGFRE